MIIVDKSEIDVALVEPDEYFLDASKRMLGDFKSVTSYNSPSNLLSDVRSGKKFGLVITNWKNEMNDNNFPKHLRGLGCDSPIILHSLIVRLPYFNSYADTNEMGYNGFAPKRKLFPIIDKVLWDFAYKKSESIVKIEAQSHQRKWTDVFKDFFRKALPSS